MAGFKHLTREEAELKRKQDVIDSGGTLNYEEEACINAFDYLVVRKRLATKFIEVVANWDNQTDENKKILVDYFVTPYKYRAEIYTFDEIVAKGKIFDRTAKLARTERYLNAKSILFNTIDKDQAEEIANTVVLQGLGELYINNGVMGIGYGNAITGVLNYIDATKNTIYEKMGIRAQRIITEEGFALDDICNSMINEALRGLI